MSLDLSFRDIADPVMRQNLQLIKRAVDSSILSGSFEHFDMSFGQAQDEVLITHGLGFQPIDVIQTFKTGDGNVTFNYDRFTREKISVTVTDACRVRFLAGLFKKGIEL